VTRGPGRLAARYSRELRSAFGLWPTWLPDARIAVGDFGEIRGGVFERKGALEDLGAEDRVRSRLAKATANHVFASTGVRQSVATVDASNVGSRAVASIEFGRSFGVLVLLSQCCERRVDDMAHAGHTIGELADRGVWDHGWCLVTGVVEADAALVAVSSGQGAKLELGLPSAAGALIDHLQGGLQVTSESGLAYRSTIGMACTPLFRLTRLAGVHELAPRGGTMRPSLLDVDATEGLD
jgi:hypothetical protein